MTIWLNRYTFLEERIIADRGNSPNEARNRQLPEGDRSLPYIRMLTDSDKLARVNSGWFESNSSQRLLRESNKPPARADFLKAVVGRVGVEPTTYGLRVRCSTN